MISTRSGRHATTAERLKAATRSEALAHARAQAREKVGRATLRAFAFAVLLGVITYFLGHQGAGFTVALGVLAAIVVAVVSFLWLLMFAVGGLELRYAEAREQATLSGRRIGAHKAIYAWVDGCERSLADPGQATPQEAHVSQELTFLEANVLNSLAAYPYYSADLSRQVKELAAGEPGEPPSIRLDRLLAQLRKNLAAGTYLV